MRSTASTRKFASAFAALSLASAILFSPAMALGEPVRNSDHDDATIGNWVGASSLKRAAHRRSRIVIIERRGDQDSCRNTLFATLPSRKCPREADTREVALSVIGKVKAKPPVQEILVPDATIEVPEVQLSAGQKPPPPKKTAQLDIEQPKSMTSTSILDPKAVKPDELEKDVPRSPLTLSCEKVAAIVGDYGFNGIRASDCDGQVYSFDASRDGKPFMITLNSVSGELIKVRKAIP
jgi:hypothetical protein